MDERTRVLDGRLERALRARDALAVLALCAGELLRMEQRAEDAERSERTIRERAAAASGGREHVGRPVTRAAERRRRSRLAAGRPACTRCDGLHLSQARPAEPDGGGAERPDAADRDGGGAAGA